MGFFLGGLDRAGPLRPEFSGGLGRAEPFGPEILLGRAGQSGSKIYNPVRDLII